jgi:hypothetical protein
MNTPTTAPTTTQAPTTLPSTPPSLPPAEPSTTPIIPETLNISLADLNKLRGQEQASQIEEIKKTLANPAQNSYLAKLESRLNSLEEKGLISHDVADRLRDKVFSPDNFDSRASNCWLPPAEAERVLKAIEDYASTNSNVVEVRLRVRICFDYGGGAAIVNRLDSDYSTLVGIENIDATPDKLWNKYKGSIVAISSIDPNGVIDEARKQQLIEEQAELTKLFGKQLQSYNQAFQKAEEDRLEHYGFKGAGFQGAQAGQNLPLTSGSLSAIFNGGSNSLVAKAVGSAEGTRTPDGGFTDAYKGHRDPGNRAHNLGTFSYQHGAQSPEDADNKQLAVLSAQTKEMVMYAESQGIHLNLDEVMNGIDLLNQAPLCVTGNKNYIDWLKIAKDKIKAGDEIGDPILYARVNSYRDATGKFDAPGLGKDAKDEAEKEVAIRYDQNRRMQAINSAIAANISQTGS